MLGETEPAEFNGRNAGPSPSTIADSPGPETPGGHYTHLRHLSWPRTHSLDSFTAASFEDTTAPPCRNELVEGLESGQHLEEEYRIPSSPRSRRLCYSPQPSWQPVRDSAQELRATASSRGLSDEPRVLPSVTRSFDHWPSDWRREHEQVEQLEVARRRRADSHRQSYSTDAENDCWMATLALRVQTQDRNDHRNGRVLAAEDTSISQRARFSDVRSAAHALLPIELRSRADPFAASLYQHPRHGHSRSMSLMYQRPGAWLYDGHEGSPYRVGASGPGNPFAPPSTYAAGGYMAPPGYHMARDLERSGGSGPLAEMAKRKKRGNLPPEAKKTMMAWFKNHLHHPYPDEETKKTWIAETGLSPG